MIVLIKLFIGTIFHYFVNWFFLKKKYFLDDRTVSDHKKLAYKNENVLLTGGLIFIILFSFFVKDYHLLKFFAFMIFCTGLLSDLKILNNPLLRIIFQTVIIFIFVYIFQINISYTSIYFLDLFLENIYISFFFTVFCFLILINGTNFIDGLNTLVIGYYFIILSILFLLIQNKGIDYESFLIKDILLILFINFIFNFFGKNFLGDSGAYLISFITGYIFIDFYNNFSDLSVLFIVMMLWYPAFENLFSIIRKKFYNNKEASKPDDKHLHQKLFKFIKKKFPNLKKTNAISAFIINIYNLLIFFIACFFYKSSIALSILLIINIFIYTISYFILNNKLS